MEDELVADVRRGLFKPSPSEGAVTGPTDLMADASFEEGSFIEEYDEISRKRDLALAHLEGRIPVSDSSKWDARNAFGRQIPPCARGKILGGKLDGRRQVNVMDEGIIQKWI